MRIKMLQMAALCLSVVTVAGVAYAKTYQLTSTSMVPASRGTVDVGRDKNGNLQVNLRVEHLAKPSLLTPPASTYIVWFQEGQSAPENEGELKLDNDLKAELKTTTPSRVFDILITAETDTHSKFPSDRLALKASVQEAQR